MKKGIIYFLGLGLLIIATIFSSCTTDVKNSESTNESTSTSTTNNGVFKLSITDAPAANLKSVIIDFGEIAVSKSTESNTAEWITINSDGGTIDLLKLTNAQLQDLGVKNLSEGQYNQIRIFVTSATIVLLDDTTIDSSKIHIASNTIKIVSPFKIEKDKTTELIIDFDANHSIKKSEGVNPKTLYTITPVTRLTNKESTGNLKGTVTPIKGKTITVTAYKNNSTEPYAGTICDSNGNWMLGYLEPGTYSIQIESDTSSFEIKNKIVEKGKTTENDKVTLQ